MPSPFINNHSKKEQELIENLVDESIHLHSEQFFYLPRKLISPDELLGEDRLSRFEHAYEFDGFLESNTTFDGQGFFIQKFGGVIDYSATITISKREWEKRIAQYGKTILPNRPAEGDLIYYPTSDGLFEVKFVDDKNPFAQFGKFYTYKLTIELFQYNNEQIDTENPEIDVFESLKTFDQNAARSVWGGIDSITIEEPGTGYTEMPLIHVKSLTGSGAKFTSYIDSDGALRNVTIDDPGQGYHPEDIIEIFGNQTEDGKPAKLKIQVKTQIEQVGDRWASNKPIEEYADTLGVDVSALKNNFGTDPDLYDGKNEDEDLYNNYQNTGADADGQNDGSDNSNDNSSEGFDDNNGYRPLGKPWFN